MFFENLASYTQNDFHNDSKVIVKWHRVIRIYPKWPQSASKMLPKRPQRYPHMLKMTPKLPQMPPKVTSHTKMNPKGTPKQPQSHPRMPKMCSKCSQSHLHMPKVTPNWPLNRTEMLPKPPSYAKNGPNVTLKRPPSFIKPLEFIVKMNVFWKSTFIHPKWLHYDSTVLVKWHRSIRIYRERPQSGSRVTPKWHQRIPKGTLICQIWPQSCPKVTIACQK